MAAQEASSLAAALAGDGAARASAYAALEGTNDVELAADCVAALL